MRSVVDTNKTFYFIYTAVVSDHSYERSEFTLEGEIQVAWKSGTVAYLVQVATLG